MIVVAVLAMTLFHPALCFPQQARLAQSGALEAGSDSDVARQLEKHVRGGSL